MPKFIVITDKEGHILGSARWDPIKTGNTTIQFATRPSFDMRHHELDVSVDQLDMPIQQLHEHLYKELKRLKAIAEQTGRPPDGR